MRRSCGVPGVTEFGFRSTEYEYIFHFALLLTKRPGISIGILFQANHIGVLFASRPAVLAFLGPRLWSPRDTESGIAARAMHLRCPVSQDYKESHVPEHFPTPWFLYRSPEISGRTYISYSTAGMSDWQKDISLAKPLEAVHMEKGDVVPVSSSVQDDTSDQPVQDWSQEEEKALV